MQNERYERRQRLGDGGMGEVWRGVDNVLGRDVALKVPLPALAQDPMFIERFRREARAMASVSHENVIDIYDVLDSAGGWCIVMEYVDGGSVADLLKRRGPLPPAETMTIVAQAARGLAAAHRRNVVHRDVKPANLLIRNSDDRTSVVLTDFGIAQTPTANVLTRQGQNIGSATYMAPEIFSGGGATAQSDIYALGVVAYECLTGRPPFTGDNNVAVATMQVTKAPDPLPAQIPEPVRRVVERAMAKRPADRWATADDLVKAIEALPPMRVPQPRKAPTAPTAVAMASTAPPPPKRSRAWLHVLIALLIAGTGGALAIRAFAGPPAGGKGPAAGGSTPPVPTVPDDLRAFAPGWNYRSCTRDPQPGKDQLERWSCPLDADTAVYLIRYRPGPFRDTIKAANDRMERTDPLQRGTATTSTGVRGDYREYEVNISSVAKPDWNDEIWFDNAPSTSPSFALLLRTKRATTTQQALAHIRGLWKSAKYTTKAD